MRMSPGEPARVLVVDDYADIVEILALALEDAGYAVLSASDGPTALELVERNPVSAAIVDLGLPGIDGYEVARRLRFLPGGHETFLVALTGHGDMQTTRRTVEAGFDTHLVKPVDIDRLTAVLAARPRS